jgi:beta-galactosidase
MFNQKVTKMLYGGDYNPEQWPKDIWAEDMRMFKLADIDIATINVFSWSLTQPDEDTYNFEWLDEIIDTLAVNGIKICLGTSTAAHPAWMAKKYPDVLTVDFEGRKKKYGRRHNSCPNSPTYRKYSQRIAQKLAERYKDHSAILLWHVNNEYGVRCYCDNCEKSFRIWLQEKYATLDEVNRVWNTRFWGHTFYDWDEIVLPNLLSEHLSATNHEVTSFQGISLDYDRFISDSILDCYVIERDAIKEVIPDAFVTTNFQSNGTYRLLDYFKWARELDVIALDMYPTNDMPMSHTAMRHDLMRGLKDGDPFLLMESCPTQLNWKPQNALKRPGVNKLWSYQAISRGADSIMYFQLRRSVGAFEKFHGAVIDHVGHENTRVFRECADLGKELTQLGDSILGARVDAKVGIVFDWENWWALEHTSGPSVDLKYLNEVQKYYDAFYHQNIQVDMIGIDTKLEQYDLVIAPVLYMIKRGYAQKLEDFVQNGGSFVTTFFSGIVDEHDLVTLGGYPGELRNLLGIWVEEIDSLFPEQTNSIVMKQSFKQLCGSYESRILCDLIHVEGAEVLAEFGREFYQGMPALTRNKFGSGEAWYVASSPEPRFLTELVSTLCESKGIEPILASAPNIEVSRRHKNGRNYTFLLNHNEEEKTVNIGEENQQDMLTGEMVSGEIRIAPNGVAILDSKKNVDAGR